MLRRREVPGEGGGGERDSARARDAGARDAGARAHPCCIDQRTRTCVDDTPRRAATPASTGCSRRSARASGEYAMSWMPFGLQYASIASLRRNGEIST